MASGDSLVIFTPFAHEPPAASGAIHDIRNRHPVLDYDASVPVSGIWSSIMPQHYGGNGTTVFVHYSMSSTETNDTDWDISYERVGDQVQNVDTDGFAAAQSVDNNTVPTTSGLVTVVSGLFTDGAEMDNVTAGDQFRLAVVRDAASDTATGDAELHAVEIRES